MAHDQDKWRENKMTPTEMHYLGLSEVYLSQLEDHHTTLLKILFAKGAITEIESDLLKFLDSNQPNDRSLKQEARIKVLKDSISYFEHAASTVKQMRLIIRKNARENWELHQEIIALKADNELMNNLIKEEQNEGTV